MSYKKFKIPERTETFISVGYNIDREISILGETDKAYHIVYSIPIKKGYLRKSYRDVLLWIPKSIWDNDKYFVMNHKEQRFFQKPVWIK
tara:strand:+ start:26 stop:292 length:267 start_codon:yes stop_codon:yes gene_type:complete